jgi:hypothetical protein
MLHHRVQFWRVNLAWLPGAVGGWGRGGGDGDAIESQSQWMQSPTTLLGEWVLRLGRNRGSHCD